MTTFFNTTYTFFLNNTFGPILVHQGLVLHPSDVSEKVSANKNGVNLSNIPIK
jgi:hypothetical protein